MKKLAILACAFGLLALQGSAQAPGPIAKIYIIKVKPGMQTQFQEAYKAHIDWHREQNDSWAWDAWLFESGPRAGQFVVVTPGHHWSDFDSRGEMGQADEAHAQKTLLPLVESMEVGWSQALPELSRMPQGMSDIGVARVVDHHIKPGKDFQFQSLIRTVRGALEGTDRTGAAFWTRSVTGPSVFTLVEMFPDWASLAPPEKSMMEILASKLGPMGTAELVDSYADCVAGAEVNIVRYLKDLSYAPGAPE